MLKYLEDHYGDRATQGDKTALEAIRTETTRLKDLSDQQKEKTAGTTDDDHKEPMGSEDETDEDEEDDYLDELPEVLAKKKAKGPRASVSAEAFGMHNQKADFKPRVIPKSAEAIESIMDKIDKSFMFSGLDDKEKKIVMDAMDEQKFHKNEVVIKEGDEGDSLYVVATGTLSCTKIFKGNTEPTFLKRYEPGEAFGELALLYNAPRAATIFSDDDSTLYGLDRQTFNHIVKDAAIRKKDKYEAFLKKVSLLSTMDDYERAQVSEAFSEEKFKPNEMIIKEGDAGDKLYFIMEGECYATKVLNPGEEAKEVK